MTRYGFPGATHDLASLMNRLRGWLNDNGYDAEITTCGDLHRVNAKKTGGLREIAGMSSTMTVTCEAFCEEGVTVCEITRIAAQESLAKAAVLGFFSAGATWVTAGVAANQAKGLEVEALSKVEQWLDCRRLSENEVLPERQATKALATMLDNNDDVANQLAKAAEVSGKAVTVAATIASGFLRGAGEAAKAMGKAIGSVFSYTCPKCKESEYTKTEINRNHREEVRSAYRFADGTLNSRPPLTNAGYVQVQAVYSIFKLTWELKCKKCGHVWTERTEETYIK